MEKAEHFRVQVPKCVESEIDIPIIGFLLFVRLTDTNGDKSVVDILKSEFGLFVRFTITDCDKREADTRFPALCSL